MGIYNSSEHRVKPLMKCIENNDQNFNKFIALITDERLRKPDPQKFHYADKTSNKKEKGLLPTKKQLISLVEYLYENGHGLKSNIENRQKILNGDKNAKDLAISIIENNYPKKCSKAWYVFEGHTYPDLYIEGDDYIIVCEGKWTESHITTETTYLKADNGEYRNQMVRHIQGALNQNKNKKIYAFYIVDENCEYIDLLSKEAFVNQVEKETIALGYSEKIDVISSYCGYTTWQDLTKVIDVKFLTKDEIDKLS